MNSRQAMGVGRKTIAWVCSLSLPSEWERRGCKLIFCNLRICYYHAPMRNGIFIRVRCVCSSKDKSHSPQIWHPIVPDVLKSESWYFVKVLAWESHFCVALLPSYFFGLSWKLFSPFWLRFLSVPKQTKVTPTYNSWGKFYSDLINHKIAEIPKCYSCFPSGRELKFLFSGESCRMW